MGLKRLRSTISIAIEWMAWTKNGPNDPASMGHTEMNGIQFNSMHFMAIDSEQLIRYGSIVCLLAWKKWILLSLLFVIVSFAFIIIEYAMHTLPHHMCLCSCLHARMHVYMRRQCIRWKKNRKNVLSLCVCVSALSHFLFWICSAFSANRWSKRAWRCYILGVLSLFLK